MDMHDSMHFQSCFLCVVQRHTHHEQEGNQTKKATETRHNVGHTTTRPERKTMTSEQRPRTDNIFPSGYYKEWPDITSYHLPSHPIQASNSVMTVHKRCRTTVEQQRPCCDGCGES
mmetsp:Transcript_18354/g.20213  ORF Transcript_18354/g.20213 Transcript_18354/m.20213 type:complete len:116 (-) Transcript_18354:166-513(-)